MNFIVMYGSIIDSFNSVTEDAQKFSRLDYLNSPCSLSTYEQMPLVKNQVLKS